MKAILLPIALLLLSCDLGEQVEPPTSEEAERLNDAEAMLNELANEELSAPAQEARQP